MLQRTDLRDVTLLMGASLLLGLLRLSVHPSLPWVAEEPSAEDAACELDLAGTTLVQRIAPSEAAALVGRPDVSFVDARSGDAYVSGHIPGAMSLPAADAAGILEVSSVPIPAQNLVITYCDGAACEKSEYLGLLLRDRAGCEQVQVLEGGWNGWLTHAGPVVTGPAPGGSP